MTRNAAHARFVLDLSVVPGVSRMQVSPTCLRESDTSRKTCRQDNRAQLNTLVKLVLIRIRTSLRQLFRSIFGSSSDCQTMNCRCLTESWFDAKFQFCLIFEDSIPYFVSFYCRGIDLVLKKETFPFKISVLWTSSS